MTTRRPCSTRPSSTPLPPTANSPQKNKSGTTRWSTELRAQVRSGDNELFERAHQTAFVGTNLPLEFARKRVEVVVFTGIHLDWCIEGNVRNARDNGLLPIVIGDATGAATLEQEKVAFERINNYFAPVITSDQFVEWVS